MLADIVADILPLGSALRNDNENIALPAFIGCREAVRDLLQVKFLLGDEDVLRAARDAGNEREPAAVTAHDLEYDHAAVRRCRITQLVDRIDDRIRSRVTADCVVHPPDIVVNRSRQPDDGESELLREQLCAAQGAVSADHAEALDAALDEILMTQTAPLRRHPPIAACRSEEGASALDDIPHIHRLQLAYILLEQAVVAVIDAPDPYALIEGCACNCTCGSIHPRAVSPARHNRNAL